VGVVNVSSNLTKAMNPFLRKTKHGLLAFGIWEGLV
jgi:hypothetical protein